MEMVEEEDIRAKARKDNGHVSKEGYSSLQEAEMAAKYCR